jgi:hypothetical protein
MDPSLREDVPHGTSESLKAVAGRDRWRLDYVVKQEMTLIQGAVSPGQPDRANPILIVCV